MVVLQHRACLVLHTNLGVWEISDRAVDRAQHGIHHARLWYSTSKHSLGNGGRLAVRKLAFVGSTPPILIEKHNFAAIGNAFLERILLLLCALGCVLMPRERFDLDTYGSGRPVYTVTTKNSLPITSNRATDPS